MRSTRSPLLAALVVLSLFAVPLSAIGAAPVSDAQQPASASDAPFRAGSPADSTAAAAVQERDDDPSTEDTVGYVEGYWYDDELPVDDRNNASLDDDELEAVVYRSMARVELIRGLTFREPVPVEVVSRSEYESEHDVVANLSEAERLQENVNYEALFMVDRETNAIDDVESLYGGAVDGYYDPTTDRIVIVSNSPDEPELNEVILGHELVHALQDQHFNLTSFDRETIDQDNAKNGLIEGDAVSVETEYQERCGEEWACTLPDGQPKVPPEVNWGMYFSVFQPYDDGPDYVEYLRERGGWDAVNDAYDDPPASSAEVIHPGEEREPVAIEVEDRSSDDWRQLEIDGELASETVGEAAMVSMFAGGAIDPRQPSVIGREAFLQFDGEGYVDEIDYDQSYTDGWVGDELVTYVDDDVDEIDDPAAAAADAGYVWRTEWNSSEDADEFVDGYLRLLALHGAEPVDGRQDTFEIGDDYPGAYYVDADDETVTIVRAPSVDALDDVESGAAPEGDDTLDFEGASGGGNATGDGDTADGGDGDDAESIPGFGAPVAILSLSIGTLAIRRHRSRTRRP